MKEGLLLDRGVSALTGRRLHPRLSFADSSHLADNVGDESGQTHGRLPEEEPLKPDEDEGHLPVRPVQRKTMECACFCVL